LYRSNYETHSLNARYTTNLHLPISWLTVFQKGAHCSGIRLYNHLPSYIKSTNNDMELFKLML
jgi:hypothetical protein